MGLALFRAILTLLVSVLLLSIFAANDFAYADPSLADDSGCAGPVKPLGIWGSVLCFNHGVTAALFALAAAALLFVSLIPRLDGTADLLSEALHRLVSAVAATGAGVYWLKDEAGETAWLHVAVVFFLGGIVIGSAAAPIAMLSPLKSLLVWVARRIRAWRATRLLAKSHLEEHRVFDQIGAFWYMSFAFFAFRGGGGCDGYPDLGEHNPRPIAFGEVLVGHLVAFGAGLGQHKIPGESMGNYLLETARSCRSGGHGFGAHASRQCWGWGWRLWN